MKYTEWVHLVPPTTSQTWGSAVVELAELSRKGLPIAPSFAVNQEGVRQFFLQPSLRKAIEAALSGGKEKRAAALAKEALTIQKAIAKASLPKALHAEVAAFMDLMEQKVLHVPGGKLPLELSLYGTNGEHLVPSLWVTTKTWKDVERAFTKLLLPLFTPAEVAIRVKHAQPVIPAIASIEVRYAPEGEYSGTAQCFDPSTHDAEVIVVTTTTGHHKTHTHDVHKFDRKSLVLLNTHGHAKHVAKSAAGTHTHKVTEDGGGVLALRVARLVKQVQAESLDTKHISWSIQGGMLVVTGCSTMQDAQLAPGTVETAATLLVRGIGVVPGRVSGRAKLIATEADKKDLQPGDIAVVGMLSAKDAAWLHAASGVVIETGHSASLEAEVARELGIVAVSATHARQFIRQSQMVTLDGYRGEVHAGKVFLSVPVSPVASNLTATKLLTLVEDPLHVQREHVAGSDGIGLLRGEFLLQLSGLHPHEVYEKKLVDDYREILTEVVEKAARFAYPLPITYQLHDLSEETRGRHRHEPNPKLGYRGAHRIIQEPELLAEELGVIASLARSGLENIRIMLPAVRTIGEVVALRNMITSAWPQGEMLPEVWVRCAAPSLLIGARDLCDTGVSGVLFDVPVLAELVNGFDGDNHQVGHHLVQEHEAFLDALHYAVAVCRTEGVETGIISEGYAMQPRVLEEAVEAGLQEVVAPAAELDSLRHLLGSIEQRVMLDHARNHPYQDDSN